MTSRAVRLSPTRAAGVLVVHVEGAADPVGTVQLYGARGATGGAWFAHIDGVAVRATGAADAVTKIIDAHDAKGGK